MIRLTARNNTPEDAAASRLLTYEARRLETSVDALALAAVLAQPFAQVVLSGATTVRQLRMNLGALEVPWDEEADRRLAMLQTTRSRYWRRRGGLGWN